MFRTRPDCVIYEPSGEFGPDAENQQIIVTPLASGILLATWTMGTHENNPDQRVVVSRSEDAGKTWSLPEAVDSAEIQPVPGARSGQGQASWPFMVEAPTLARVYLFYNKNLGVTDARDDTTGLLVFRYSEDEGRTWSRPYVHLRMRRGTIDRDVPEPFINFVPCFQSFAGADGIPMASLTKWASGSEHLLNIDSEIWFVRFPNLLTEPDPEKVSMETLPEGDAGIRFPHPYRIGLSSAQEAMTVNLPDGRLFTVFRTLQGCLAWSASRDGGRTWSAGFTPPGDPGAPEALPLRYSDDGGLMQNPIVCSPIFENGPGKYFVLFYNNNGYINGAAHVADHSRNRRTAWISSGRFVGGAGQPVHFDPPVELMDAGGVPYGYYQRIEPCSYPSYCEIDGRHWLWYSDRKHFVLGRDVTDLLG